MSHSFYLKHFQQHLLTDIFKTFPRDIGLAPCDNALELTRSFAKIAMPISVNCPQLFFEKCR